MQYNLGTIFKKTYYLDIYMYLYDFAIQLFSTWSNYNTCLDCHDIRIHENDIIGHSIEQ